MLFFQLMLLLGYGYTHYVVGRLPLKRQLVLHVGLLLLSLLLLPITPEDVWKPDGAGNPTVRILLLLTVTVGMPYLMAASTAPLIQSWFTHTHAGRSPYWLYAISNVGSVLGLISYPFIVEPLIGARLQTLVWSISYGLFVMLSAGCAFYVHRHMTNRPEAVAAPAEKERVSAADRILWLLLSACGVVLLLAVTNRMSQDVAVIPLLWILPLTLYLLSFIITFGQPRLYSRPLWGSVMLGSFSAVVWLLHQDYGRDEVSIFWQIAIYSLVVFSACMVCHGELYRRRPADQHLTLFYLFLSLGGALGGAFVSLLSPLIFPGYWEFHLGLIAALLLFGVCMLRSVLSLQAVSLRIVFLAGWMVSLEVLGFALVAHIQDQQGASIATSRSFFGILRVYEYNVGKRQHIRKLYHGRIAHGDQYQDASYRRLATTYFGPGSGVGIAISAQRDSMRREGVARGMRLGVVGLGAGTLAVYAKSDDSMLFYEIDPDVVVIANDYFSYVEDAEGQISVVLGDARISMERELRNGELRRFDVLVIDAFSGDAIPVHLLTREALEVYLQHLNPDGAVAFHVSNLHFNLRPVVLALAEEAGLDAVWISNLGPGPGESSSQWVVLTKNDALFRALLPQGEGWPTPASRRLLWTDDYANVLQALDID